MLFTERQLRTLARWRLLLAIRSMWRHVVGTLQGKLVVLVLVLGSPTLWSLLRGEDGPASLELDGGSAPGAILVAQLGLTLCFAVMVPVLLLKAFVLGRDEEPLLAHPFVLPDLSLLRVIAAIAWTSLFLTTLFYIFYFQLVAAIFEPWWLGVAAHAAALQLHFAILGTLLTLAVRRLILGTRMAERARLLHRLAIAPFLFTLPLFAFAPTVLADRAPAWLSFLGEHPALMAFLLQAPVAFAHAATAGAALPAAAWAGGLFFGAWWCAAALRSWSRRAPQEFPLDLNANRLPVYANAFGSRWARPGGGALRHVSLFWTKDVLVGYLRRPTSYVQEQLTLATGAASCLVLVRVAVAQLGLGPAAAGAGVMAIALALAAVLAMLPTLGSLGREGAQIALLRPVLNPSRLFTLKLLAGAAYVLPHAAAYTLLVAGAAALLGLPAPATGVLLVTALSAAALLSFVGMALAFLLPDFDARHLFLPGASGLAKYLYAFSAALVVAYCAMGGFAVLTGRWGAAELAGFIFVILLIAGCAALLAAVWGVQRLQRIEL